MFMCSLGPKYCLGPPRGEDDEGGAAEEPELEGGFGSLGWSFREIVGNPEVPFNKGVLQRGYRAIQGQHSASMAHLGVFKREFYRASSKGFGVDIRRV